METVLTLIIGGAVLSFFFIRYWFQHRKKEAEARAAAERGGMYSDGPKAQHPHIHVDNCIGCGTCVKACPEGDVLAVINGKASIINGHKCIGHSLCADECPVGAITMVMAAASATADMPRLSTEMETSVENLFIAGELGGLALIKNAVNQGRDCVDVIAARFASGPGVSGADIFDLLIVGAGPAGISASLRAAERNLKTITLERDSVGGTVSKYPRQKLVMTSPVEFPLHGKFRKTALSKEELLEFWKKIMERTDLNIKSGEVVELVRKDDDGLFSVKTAVTSYRARAVVLALGRAGTPRKLGVPGEDMDHVYYRLIEADHYTHKNILIVGGGDSAVEAAMGLAHQAGNKVTLSYRRGEFMRLKDRNTKRIEEHIKGRRLEVLFNSAPKEFLPGKVILECKDGVREVPNDYVWIFAGGIPPSDFLKAAGIEFGSKDMRQETAALMSV
jgi:thioredoxin reductase (NADPH)